MQTTLPAISLWQPYASLIAIGAKTYETRHWEPPRFLIGQRIAIHAAARKPTRAEVGAFDDEVALAFGRHNWHRQVPYGAVVCTAILADSWWVRVPPYNGHVVAFRAGLALPGSAKVIKTDAFGDYSGGRWLWELRDIEPLKPPVPAKGRQSWWHWTPPAEAA